VRAKQCHQGTLPFYLPSKEGTLDSGGWSQKLNTESCTIPQPRHFIQAGKTYFLFIILEDFAATEFDRAFSSRQRWLCQAISNTLKFGTESIIETVENFHTLTLLSAPEGFIEFSLYL
jgi:hypothetical protein